MHRILTADDDLNDITQNGIYYYYTEDVPLNAPYENASIVEVFGSNSDTTQKVQRVTRYGISGYTSERTLLSNEWLGWVQFVTNADLPLSAKTYQLGGGQTLSFSYAGGNASCLIFAVRDSNAGIYLCDNWNQVVTAKDFANLNVSISNKTVTIQNNNANMAISIIVLIANNMPIAQA